MDNYIGKVDAEWVDPVVELPEQGNGIIVRNTDGGVSLAEWHNSPWPMGRWIAWLRIGGPSDAIPRAKVQAAVDLMEKQRKIMASTPSATDYNEAYADGLIDYHMEIKRHTGVTPGVKDSLTTQEAPHA